jgi:hypothetical protein
MTTDTRQAYIDGLHQIAEFLTEHPEVPLPYQSGLVAGQFRPAVMRIYLVGEAGPREKLAAITRAMGNVDKSVNEATANFEVHRQFAGITLLAAASRADVCERVVTGTREVTKEIPDPEALAAVPKVTVTEVVEDVDWVCQPLLKTPSTSLLRVPEGAES